MIWKKSALAMGLALAACGSDPAPAPTATEEATPTAEAAEANPTQANAPGLAIESEGLRLFDQVTGSARPIPFGTAWDDVRAMLAFRGNPRAGVMEECGAGRLDYVKWDDSLTLYGQDGKFTGWFADTGAQGTVSTASGIGPGSTRKELEDVYSAKVSETSLGTEFSAGDLFGLFASDRPDAIITAMWAGTSCNFT